MESWLQNLSPDTAIIVPTRSLANALSEDLAQSYLEKNISVWESPNILLWSDYLKLLWQFNQNQAAQQIKAHSLISNQQSLLLWTQVIEKSRRSEQALTLLNVQQTAKAVQKSWRLMHDWQVSIDSIQKDHVADTQQFIEWLEEYENLLKKRGLMDESQLASSFLAIDHKHPFKELIWHSYDLITANQKSINQYAQENGILISDRTAKKIDDQKINYCRYANQHDELTATLIAARDYLERHPVSNINIVVPDLQHRQAQVREIAREVFYPSLSPLQWQQNSSAYRFSLGQPLQQWPAIEVAVSLINLLKNRVKLPELSFILRNRFLRLGLKNQQECRTFDTWLRYHRVSAITVERLPELYRQCLVDNPLHGESTLLPALEQLLEQLALIQQNLANAKADKGYAVMSFSQWAEGFDRWLAAWGWSTNIAGEEMSSAQYQLRERWLSLLKEYVALEAVQEQVGISRAIEILQQMTHDTIFQPQAVASPILISGVYEAIGQKVDICFLTGMNQDYPAAAKNDAFIPNRLLAKSGYPEATAIDSFTQARQVIDTLLNPSAELVLSFSRENQQNREIDNNVSPLFRKQFTLNNWLDHEAMVTDQEPVELIVYDDTEGPSWPSNKMVKGGSRIFTNQSVCAFKGFVTHQLGFARDEEPEFGLDAMDRGNIVHALLEVVWGELQTQQTLLDLGDSERQHLIEMSVATVLKHAEGILSQEKCDLLQHERPRLIRLLDEWLEEDAERPSGFSVLETEEGRYAEFAGIGFHYIIDRVDILDDGRTVVIDYKTGAVAKKDWLGERLRDTQLPLYALALNKEKRKNVSGIAFAKVKQGDCKYDFLSEAGAFKTTPGNADKVEQIWLQQSALWPDIFTQLAQDFLAGKAEVNPIDQKVCNYCELASVCRISQLSGQLTEGDSEEESYD